MRLIRRAARCAFRFTDRRRRYRKIVTRKRLLHTCHEEQRHDSAKTLLCRHRRFDMPLSAIPFAVTRRRSSPPTCATPTRLVRYPPSPRTIPPRLLRMPTTARLYGFQVLLAHRPRSPRGRHATSMPFDAPYATLQPSFAASAERRAAAKSADAPPLSPRQPPPRHATSASRLRSRHSSVFELAFFPSIAAAHAVATSAAAMLKRHLYDIYTLRGTAGQERREKAPRCRWMLPRRATTLYTDYHPPPRFCVLHRLSPAERHG